MRLLPRKGMGLIADLEDVRRSLWWRDYDVLIWRSAVDKQFWSFLFCLII